MFPGRADASSGTADLVGKSIFADSPGWQELGI
jgi:hypothetical protein